MEQNQSPREGEPVGKSVMDAEHELLHRILDELKAELQAGGARVHELLDRFATAAQAHFLEEQSLMRLHAYPGYGAHQNEHDELIEELRLLAQRIQEGEGDDSPRLIRALDDWLRVHQTTEDAALEEYLRLEGIRSRGAS